jgi:hypothetical protein
MVKAEITAATVHVTPNRYKFWLPVPEDPGKIFDSLMLQIPATASKIADAAAIPTTIV